MNILHRNKIIKKIKENKDMINDAEGYFLSDIDRDYTKDSNVQQCSVDLHAGQIYIPEAKPNEFGGIKNPIIRGHILKAGETLLVRTLEKVKLPKNIAGICLAPSRITLRGILVTNTGHVDPGYEGHLHFALINMGKSEYSLRKKDVVCTMLLIELEEDTIPHGEEKLTDAVPDSIAENLPLLSKDFLDVERRAQKIAQDIADSSEKKVKKWSVIAALAPLGIAIIIALIALYPYLFSKPWEPEIAALKLKIKKIDYCKEFDDNTKKINKIEPLEKRVKALEMKK